MKSIKQMLIGCVLLIGACNGDTDARVTPPAAVEGPAKIIQDLMVMTTEQFDEQVYDKEAKKMISDKPWFIKFYAPWCKHCQNLLPAWKEIANVKKDVLNVRKVDCTADDAIELC